MVRRLSRERPTIWSHYPISEPMEPRSRNGLGVSSFAQHLLARAEDVMHGLVCKSARSLWLKSAAPFGDCLALKQFIDVSRQ